jgi:ATP-dependent DNA helicase RecG
MKPSINKLQKFFTLEAERYYDNKAVMGGLITILDPWEASAREDEVPEAIIQLVRSRLKDYQRLNESSRRDILKGLWERIRKEFGREGQETAPLPTKETKTSGPVKTEVKTAPHPSTPARTIKKTATKKKRVKPEGPPAAFDADVSVLDGVGPKNKEKLEKLGIFSLGDMLYHYPRRYNDFSQLKTINRLQYNEEVTVIGVVKGTNVRTTRGKLKMAEVAIMDGTGTLRITFFNQPYITKTISKGESIAVSGKIDRYLGRLVMNNPEWEMLDQENLHTNRITPVYPLTANITQKWLRTKMNKVVNYWALRVREPLPKKVLDSSSLMDLAEALLQVHFPDSMQELESAKYRLAFDEIFYLQLGVIQQKRKWMEREAASYSVSEEWIETQISKLPFELTNAQKKALNDLQTDLKSGKPMNRLLQGDVGSGKTIIAALGIGIVTNSGAQTALLAPTSVLAEQHYRTMLRTLTENSDILKPEQIRLILGATPESEKKEIRESLKTGRIKLIIGTHALLEGPVEFERLQLAIIDEQHRFGVEQRSILRAKGNNPHLLVMTATPIPRSLSLTVFGDLDLSVMDELPPGRQEIGTYILFPKERERAYRLIKKEVDAGGQAFVIYPLVEESDKSESKAAVEDHAKFQKEIFPDLRIGLLHGRMKANEKEEVMAKFRDKELDVLVSTSVIEVGVDIPNATVMVIEGANRFGLAQLHQFRGRVGRGEKKSFCLLIPEKSDDVENERLKAMTDTNDGFILAERDLEQRGPGEFLGSRQSGFGHLKMASITDVKLIENARTEAGQLLGSDPELSLPEHKLLAEIMDYHWHKGEGDIS